MSLNEADTRAKLIDPALHARGWTEGFISREVTAGMIEIVNGKARRRAQGRVDYTLRVRVNSQTQPIAVALIEAKAESLPPGHGLEQGKGYGRCKRLNVPFIYSSNGHLFVEYDCFTGETSQPRPIAEFPTPEELRRRYEEKMGFRLDEQVAKPLLAPYAGGEGGRRYYQDAAIRAVLEKIARCEHEHKPKRALLSLATGAGKTFIAVNLLKKIADAGQLRRALFICDRDELRSQGLTHLQNMFGSDAAEVFKDQDGRNHARNARIHIATYQTLDSTDETGAATFLTQHYPEGYFSHLIIDECHRSAWGKWSEVLKRNPDAVQVGLTATPREIDADTSTAEAKADTQVTADNIKYFGEPVYEYDIGQGIEDGYLAACEIKQGRVNIDDTGITVDDIIARKPVDALTGKPLGAEYIRDRYERADFEGKILLPDRVLAMCKDLFKYLLETGGPEQKAIIFCVRDRHADEVAATMNNLYAAWCRDQKRQRLEPYAFKCTASVSGNDFLADLRGAPRSHFIATTVDLLTTGVDVPVVRNIVFFKYVKSPISFYQMIGRGTRIDLASNKLMFTVFDYTNATRLFNQAFITKLKPRTPSGPGPEGPEEPIVSVEGFDVKVTPVGHFIVTAVDGQTRMVTVEEYRALLATKLVEEAKTLDEFRDRWIKPQDRKKLLGHLPESGRSASLIQRLEHMDSYDLFDVLGEIGYGLAPRTRTDRVEAFGYKHEKWLKSLPPAASATLRAMAAQFADAGTDGLESPVIFDTPEVKDAGGIAALRAMGKPAEILLQAKARIFAA